MVTAEKTKDETPENDGRKEEKVSEEILPFRSGAVIMCTYGGYMYISADYAALSLVVARPVHWTR